MNKIKIDDAELFEKMCNEAGVEKECEKGIEIPDITPSNEVPDISLGFKKN